MAYMCNEQSRFGIWNFRCVACKTAALESVHHPLGAPIRNCCRHSTTAHTQAHSTLLTMAQSAEGAFMRCNGNMVKQRHGGGDDPLLSVVGTIEEYTGQIVRIRCCDNVVIQAVCDQTQGVIVQGSVMELVGIIQNDNQGSVMVVCVNETLVDGSKLSRSYFCIVDLCGSTAFSRYGYGHVQSHDSSSTRFPLLPILLGASECMRFSFFSR